MEGEEFSPDEVILAQKPDFVAARYDVHTRKPGAYEWMPEERITIRNNVFFIKNDDMFSLVKAVKFHMYTLEGEPNIMISVILQPGVNPIDKRMGFSPLGPRGMDLRYMDIASQMVPCRPDTQMSNCKLFRGSEIVSRDSENGIDQFLDQFCKEEEIGPDCRRKLIQVISAIGMAIHQGSDTVSARQMDAIGRNKSGPSQPGSIK